MINFLFKVLSGARLKIPVVSLIKEGICSPILADLTFRMMLWLVSDDLFSRTEALYIVTEVIFDVFEKLDQV